jgi:hypothetical protein
VGWGDEEDREGDAEVKLEEGDEGDEGLGFAGTGGLCKETESATRTFLQCPSLVCAVDMENGEMERKRTRRTP